VYGQPPLTRQERAANVRKRNYFTKYAEPAQQVLNTLLDKYADEGVQEIEDVQVLKLKPFDALGRPLEIIILALAVKGLCRGNKRTGKRNLPVAAALSLITLNLLPLAASAASGILLSMERKHVD
jgi:type I site-specific restriction endonuclease